MDSSHDLSDIAPDTERFADQTCPSCGGTATVELCFATVDCETCGEPMEVAPLP